MENPAAIYYKVRDIVRRLGHAETDTVRVYQDWHVELRVGAGHVSVWASDGIVYLTMMEKPVYYRPGRWEDYVARLHTGQPRVESGSSDLRQLLRAQYRDPNQDGSEVVGEEPETVSS